MTDKEFLNELKRCKTEGDRRWLMDKAKDTMPHVNEYDGLTLNEMRKKFYAKYGPTHGVVLEED